MGKYTGILHAYFYKITGKELLSMLVDKHKYKSKDIPEYIIRKDDKKLTDLAYYQFAEDEDEIIVCDVKTSDYILQEEISQCGLNEYEIILKGETIDEYNPHIIINDEKGYIPTPTIIKMSVTWWQDSYSLDGDSLTEFEVLKRENS